MTGSRASEAEAARPSDPDGGPRVTPRIDRQVFRGPGGLRDLPLEGRYETRDDAGFHAEIVRAQLGALVLRRTSITPHRAILDGHERGFGSDVLHFMTVRHGTLTAAPPGGTPIRMEVGDAVFTCRPRAYVYQTNGPLVTVTSVLPVTSLPAAVRRLEDLPVGPLPHAPLVDAVVELLVGLADRLDETWSFDADYAARGLIELETAILTELIAPQVPAPGPDRVRQAAVDYIDRHLGDPDLRPPQIAEALGVSLRYLHRAFDDTATTVARHLRERRLEQVAEVLRATDRNPQLRGIASRFGFSTHDQLARAFRRRYGMSMRDFHAASHRG